MYIKNSFTELHGIVLGCFIIIFLNMENVKIVRSSFIEICQSRLLFTKVGKFAKIGKIHMLHAGKKRRGRTLARENYRKRKLGKKREGMEGKVKLGRERRKVIGGNGRII